MAVVVAWDAYLPALEEWLRRTGALLRGEADTPDAVAEPLPLDVQPGGPLPPHLADRVRAAVAETTRLEALGAARRAALVRAAAYAGV